MLAMHRDAAVMATLGGVRDHVATDTYMAVNLKHWERYGFGIYRLGDREDRALVGRAGLRHVTVGGQDEIEVAYALLSPYWGRGTATMIALKLVALAQESRLCSSVVAFTLRSTHRSRRVKEKAGFAYERDFEHAGASHVLYRHPCG
jgi:ribosomal-protein-alanine N-acetyltransferase